jgi:hypothetical protein
MTVAAGPSANGHTDPRERRKQPRKGTLWHGELRTPAGMVACRVLNLSARGAQLEMDATLTPGQCVTLIMEPLGEFLSTVTWARDGKAGIRINEHRTTRMEIALPRPHVRQTFAGRSSR